MTDSIGNVVVLAESPASAQATIANGESLSGAVDLAGLYPVAILMPAAWTAAVLTLQVSSDGVTYRNVYSEYGVERSISVGVDRCVVLPPADMFGFRYLKLRSGTAGTPVAQGAERSIGIVLRKY